MAAIVCEGLSKTYASLGKKTVHSLRALDLQVEENEVFGFLGRNGAGKTTTIKLLTGLIHPTAGDAALFGVSARLPEARLRVGYMPEQPYFYEYLSPRETVEFYARLRGLTSVERAREWERISALLDLCDIADRRIRGFSKGMRQRVGFAVALVCDPPLLILDEPMSGLDPLGRRMIRELILNQRAAGKTIFFSSHVLSDVEEISDRVGILVAGRLAACGSVESLVGDVPKSVELRVANLTPDVVASLKEQAYGCALEQEDVWRLAVGDMNAANALVRQILQSGGTLVSMHPMLESLEDFFARIQEGAGVHVADPELPARLAAAEE